ncbi:sn-glycerol-3-phosphate import ATP-binding protein UgpC [Citreicella sp. SE45]|nr:sn-glycerol-3-phosphate import ATP-binding protein UgpC [Citreicella sp. SE45]
MTIRVRTGSPQVSTESSAVRCGKSALRTVSKPTRMMPAQRNVALVFQQYSLYPHMTVRGDLAFPLKSPLLRYEEAQIARKLRADLRVELKNIQAQSGVPFLYVSHDQIEAMAMASHVGVRDQGRLVQFGSPREIYEDPVSVYAASRLGQPRINILPADLFAGASGAARCIGLRPEQIRQGDCAESREPRAESREPRAGPSRSSTLATRPVCT